ncbi:hypothetical protein SARC_04110 [Sphaeroforma arctica JP610]|uniref:Ion transport domain-containing protein n=1 Tax=Sphaeroforma arctica JP610 TaxID=667725 RepID=A0A0L0G461_9EUKA|nr:hypothetical protein SARC_04110 [Sphaeroforma arctica JP610]KNC83649.1 hypothetical protein SARC_04110 [Sphaeroforma arctica JP610]|eukprot:XP_014157551.1 hypothetical protein SARC_04110 [Sphaeroforma arctica JP610]
MPATKDGLGLGTTGPSDEDIERTPPNATPETHTQKDKRPQDDRLSPTKPRVSGSNGNDTRTTNNGSNHSRRTHHSRSPLSALSQRLHRPSNPEHLDSNRLNELLRTIEIGKANTNRATEDTSVLEAASTAQHQPEHRKHRTNQAGTTVEKRLKASDRHPGIHESASFDFSTLLLDRGANNSSENLNQHAIRFGRQQRNMPSPSSMQFEASTSPRLTPPRTGGPRVLRSQSVSTYENSNATISASNSVRSVRGTTEIISEAEEVDVPLIHLTEAEREENLLQAVCFVEDALNGRNFYHRIDEFGLKWYYRIYYHSYITALVRLCSIVYLLVALMEKSHPTLALIIDQVIICVIAAYTILKYFLCGNAKFFFRHWDIVCSLAIMLSEMELIVEMMGYASATDFRIRRYMKPVFFVCFSSWLKATIKNVARTAIKVLPLLGILAYFILFMAVLGLILFSGIPEGKESFSNPLNATMSLVVLLTTANHPDVMMPFYSINGYYATFFVVFLLIATFFLLNIATAHMYYHFRGFLKSSLSNRRLRHHAGIRAAFELLDMLSPELKDAVDVGTVHKFVCRVSELQQYQPFILQMLDSHVGESVNFDEFYILTNIPRQLSVEVITPKHPRPWGYNEFSFKLLDIVRSPIFGIVQDIMMFLGCAWSILSVFNSLNILNVDVHFHIASLFLVSFYPMEILILVVGYGPKYYFLRNRWHMWDSLLAVLFLVVRVGLVSLFVASNPEHADFRWQLFCLLLFGWQSLRICRQVPVLRIYFGVISNIMQSLLSNDTALFSYVLLFFYGFAALGHDLFAGSVTHDNPLVANTEYARLDYWANNFDDIPTSMMTLWELMVVNNWFIIMEAYVAANSQWARVYFIAWYVVSVILIFNLLVAFILDTFIVKWDQILRKTKEGSEKRGLIRSVSSINGSPCHFKFGTTETHYLRRREDYNYTIQSDDPFGSENNDPTERRIIDMLRQHEELWMKISEVVSFLDADDIQNWERREAHRFSDVALE